MASRFPRTTLLTAAGDPGGWSRAVDVADILTALAASLAVVLATWLGLKAIRVAKAETNQARETFLYAQVDSVLESALALTSAAKDLETDPSREAGQDQRALRRNAEAFRSRIRVLKALRLIQDDAEATDRMQQFAAALVPVALARQQLMREGRGVLLETLLDGSDPLTSDLLADLAETVHGHGVLETADGHRHEANDGAHVSLAFDGHHNVAATLRHCTGRADWTPTVNESLRLVMPWLRTMLGWWAVQYDEGGTPSALVPDSGYDRTFFDEQAMQLVEPPRDQQAVEDWLQAWPGKHFWRPDDDEQSLAPEELVETLLSDLSAELLDRLLELVAHLREGLPEVEID